MSEQKDQAKTVQREIPPEQWKKIDTIIERYKHKEGTLIPVLKETQELIGYLPLEVQHYVAAGLKLPPSQIYGVVFAVSLVAVH